MALNIYVQLGRYHLKRHPIGATTDRSQRPHEPGDDDRERDDGSPQSEPFEPVFERVRFVRLVALAARFAVGFAGRVPAVPVGRRIGSAVRFLPRVPVGRCRLAGRVGRVAVRPAIGGAFVALGRPRFGVGTVGAGSGSSIMWSLGRVGPYATTRG
ncbi:hypothetical protein C463_13954 [Halorubrum californiense DSM 19288]|uniref:Uncharacterized protein n=1 Tax=Halorubrum californiense DSM 19288 TaxID=1227465 RepID=M0E4Q0_9EURY|nr:hypothetical protein C463_13954 [Halorubrum californiense DSM 19288]